MATKAEVEFWKDQCRKLTAALDRSLKDKHALTARIWDNSEEAKTARAVADGLEWQVEELEVENARLREMVHSLLQCHVEDTDTCAKCRYRSPLHGGCMADVKADELGVEP